MGACTSTEDALTLTPEQKEMVSRVKGINTDLDKRAKLQKDKEDHIAKLLLLGTGESGKSTVFRQMIRLFGKGFQQEQRIAYRSAVFQNVLESALILIKENQKREEAKESDFALGDAAKEARQMIIDQRVKKDDKLNLDLAKAIKTLWEDPAFKLTFKKRLSPLLPDSAEYFFEKVETLAHDDYAPSDDDLLHVRIRTSGLIKEDFQIENLKFRLLDVGGQRNERRKWIHTFEEVTAVIFVTAISEYDQVCFEDEETNRVIESLNLFEELANSRWFSNTSMILFLNKRDLFDKKFGEIPLSKCFPDWQGQTKEEAYEFFKEKFRLRLPKTRDIFSHVTNATDSDNIFKVFHAVRHIIVKTQLTDGGFL